MSGSRITVVLMALALLAGVALVPMLIRREKPVAAQTGTATEVPTVQTEAVERRTMTRTVRLAGTLKSGSQATLSPKIGGKVLAVMVRAGEAVRRGQLLVRLDAADTQRQVEQAAAGVEAARAQWRKAQDGRRLKRLEVERRVSEARRGLEAARLGLRKAEAGIRLQGKASQADVARAEAGVEAARAALARARQGATPEQREQARLQLQQAERGEKLAARALADVQFLFDRGGVPRIKLDEARESHQKALDGVKQARLGVQQAEAGATPAEIAAAEAQIRQAEAGLAAARAGAGREELDEADLAQARAGVATAEAGLKDALASRSELDLTERDVDAARAALDQALAAQRLAAQQLAAARISSPVDGTVSQVNTHPGEMAGPGQPLVVVVGRTGVYLEAAAPGRVVDALSPGQPARVTVDAQRTGSYSGVVRTVSRVAGSDGRSFPVEVEIQAPDGQLKAGGLARAEVDATTYPQALTVSVASLRSRDGISSVWVVRAGRVEEVRVTVPFQDGERAVVEGSLLPGDAVVLGSNSGVAPGDRVRAARPEGTQR